MRFKTRAREKSIHEGTRLAATGFRCPLLTMSLTLSLSSLVCGRFRAFGYPPTCHEKLQRAGALQNAAAPCPALTLPAPASLTALALQRFRAAPDGESEVARIFSLLVSSEVHFPHSSKIKTRAIEESSQARARLAAVSLQMHWSLFAWHFFPDRHRRRRVHESVQL